jgi:rod shape-determining protein MreD
MRWIIFFILLYLAAMLHMSHLAAFPAGPTADGHFPEILYLPMLAIFYALFAADPAATIVALICGGVLDLLGGEKIFLGTDMIPLALVCWFIVRVRMSIFREHAVSQMMMTLFACLGFALLSTIFRKLVGAPFDDGALKHFGTLSADAVYTAIVAPAIFWVLFRFPGILGFTTHGPRGHG